MVGESIEWLLLHIVISVATYALITLAALAALSAALQERALKARRPTPFTRRLPAVAECEAATLRFLAAGEIVLAMGIATGMALSFLETGRILIVNHKTILVLAAFVVIGAVLAAHARSGLRGRAIVRAVMAAYLLMTLGYPGVKFVTDVLLGSG
ncbi:MAG: cytochrome c biogenesis protein CcsA [Proteobacteria bacterium]|nr:cytochrome c biogenesis protein CcsA [Pseudomonadota bacterium]